MCGVFGFVGERPNLDRLARIAKVTEQRGPHAFGFAWIDDHGRMHCWKRRGRISEHLESLGMMADARLVIGHCRFTTQGTEAKNINNHPHPSDGGWIVHNGMIPDWEDLVYQYDLALSSQCDSEVLAQLVARSEGADYAARCADAVGAVDAARPLVMLGLWKPGTLVAVRRGNPLCVGHTKAGLYLASLPKALPKNCRPVPDGTAWTLGWNADRGVSMERDRAPVAG